MAPFEKRHDHSKVCVPAIMIGVFVPSVLIFSAFFVKWLVRRKPQKEVVGGGGRLTGGGPWPGIPPPSFGNFGGFGGRNPGRPSQPVRSSSGTHRLEPISPGRPLSYGRPRSRPPSAGRPPSLPGSSRKLPSRTPSKSGSRGGSSRDHGRDGIPPNSMFKE